MPLTELAIKFHGESLKRIKLLAEVTNTTLPEVIKAAFLEYENLIKKQYPEKFRSEKKVVPLFRVK